LKPFIRWGILGTAEVALVHTIPAMICANNAEVVAIASESGKAAEAASQFGIEKSFSKYQELLDDQEIDAVYIPLPNHLHAKWVMQAAKNGKHVLCEKPSALSAEEARDMLAICRENQVLFMETFMYRFHPQNARVREIIASGEIGDVKLLRSSCSFYLNRREGNYRLRREMGGGSLYDVGCYCIHAFRMILQTEPTKVYVQADLDPTQQVDISARGMLEFENGVKAMFDCSMEMTQHMSYEIIGTKGMVQVPRAFRPDLAGGEGLVIVTNNEGEVREEKLSGYEYKLAIEHFSQCIIDGIQPEYSGDSTIQNMKVLDACHESIRTGKVIQVM
jgi:D-xylose 1-dehydrogenase (NADP+, D-xylono-1,5-lactone-forming)